MLLVVDTNILFSFFWKDSFLAKIMVSQELELFSPEYALEEIKKYEKEIRIKTGLSNEEFNKKRAELPVFIAFIPLKEYQESLKKLKDVPDKNDIDFLALALKLKCPLWSNDIALKKQNQIKTITTKELLKEI